MSAPVEVTTKFATTVDGLTEAWAFVMAKVDQVGPDPRITISPIWTISASASSDEDPPRRFEVSVSGMVHEKENER